MWPPFFWILPWKKTWDMGAIFTVLKEVVYCEKSFKVDFRSGGKRYRKTVEAENFPPKTCTARRWKWGGTQMLWFPGWWWVWNHQITKCFKIEPAWPRIVGGRAIHHSKSHVFIYRPLPSQKGHKTQKLLGTKHVFVLVHRWVHCGFTTGLQPTPFNFFSFCDTRPPPYLRSTRWKLASSLGVSKKKIGVQHVMWWWMRSRGPAWFKMRTSGLAF